MRTLHIGPAALLACLAPLAFAQQGGGTEVVYPVHGFKPDKVAATPERIAALKAPPGFRVGVFASGLGNAGIVAVAPDGTVYVSRRDEGDVVMLKDANGDGRLGPLTMLIGDLPDSGQHPNRSIAFGPDGMLYISVGSTCNACNESNPENATMLRATPDGKSPTIVATGLRNTIGFAWHPATGELWGMDHGIDYLGDEIQPEELNKIEFGKQYGWPHVWGGAGTTGGLNPQSTPVGAITKEQWRASSKPMVVGAPAHAAPMQMVFARAGAFSAACDGDALVTLRGTWNRNPASGYEVARVRFVRGQATAVEPFVSGFLSDGGKTHFARPVGLAFAKDGALLMADDGNGVLYRIAYEGAGGQRAASAGTAPAAAMNQQVMKGSGVPLALERTETASGTRSGAAALSVQSSFANDAAMATKHSEYADGVSMPLQWSAVPGARSYLVVMEDPDARPVTPFVHWLAWNIPAGVTALPEGVQEQPRLTEPAGVLQGRTSRGSVGYYGPPPPARRAARCRPRPRARRGARPHDRQGPAGRHLPADGAAAEVTP